MVLRNHFHHTIDDRGGLVIGHGQDHSAARGPRQRSPYRTKVLSRPRSSCVICLCCASVDLSTVFARDARSNRRMGPPESLIDQPTGVEGT